MSSRDFNGLLRLAIGIPGTGKTTYAIHQLPKVHLIVAPGPTNPAMENMDYVQDNEKGLAYVKKNPSKTLCLYVVNGNPAVFDVISSSPGRTILLDDIGMYSDEAVTKRALVSWCTGVRWRGLNAWATTQRARAEVPPKVYTAARQIFNIGPNKDMDEAREIFGRRSVDMTFEDFYAKLQTLENYHWQKRNVAGSVFKIKDLT